MDSIDIDNEDGRDDALGENTVGSDNDRYENTGILHCVHAWCIQNHSAVWGSLAMPYYCLHIIPSRLLAWSLLQTCWDEMLMVHWPYVSTSKKQGRSLFTFMNSSKFLFLMMQKSMQKLLLLVFGNMLINIQQPCNRSIIKTVDQEFSKGSTQNLDIELLLS